MVAVHRLWKIEKQEALHVAKKVSLKQEVLWVEEQALIDDESYSVKYVIFCLLIC